MMSEIIYDEQGNPIWSDNTWIDPNEKLETIKSKLSSKLDTVKRKVDANDKSMYPRKLNFNPYITSSLLNELSSYQNVQYNDAIAISIDTLKEYIGAFRKLWSWVLDYYIDYIATKQQFCAFCGISYNAYNQLLLNDNPEIAVEMERLEGDLGEVQVLSAQSGLNKEKTTETRLRADGIGHGMNLKNEEERKQIIQIVSYTPDAINQKLANMGLMIENKKK